MSYNNSETLLLCFIKKVKFCYFRELKNKINKHATSSFFNALERALELQWVLLILISDLQDGTSMKSNVENF